MSTMAREFPNGEVEYYGVNWAEDRAAVEDYVKDAGLTGPIAMDNRTFADTELPGCYITPSGAESLSQLLFQKVGEDGTEPPFPLQLIIGCDGTFAYASRSHQPDRIVEILRRLVSECDSQ